jgi:hypothetical protein
MAGWNWGGGGRQPAMGGGNYQSFWGGRPTAQPTPQPTTNPVGGGSGTAWEQGIAGAPPPGGAMGGVGATIGRPPPGQGGPTGWMTPGFGQNGTMGGAGLNSQNTWNPAGPQTGGLDPYTLNGGPQPFNSGTNLRPPSPNYGSNAQGNFSQDFGLNQGGGASGGGFPGSSYNPMMRSNGASTMAAMQQQLGRQQQLQSNPYSQQLAMLAPYGATEIKMNPELGLLHQGWPGELLRIPQC